jgi:Flp pilus assembly secretin CpaC
MFEKLSVSILVSLVSLSAAAARADDSVQTLSVAAGDQVVLQTTELRRVAIGDPSVVEIKPIGAQGVIVTGIREGSTTLLIWSGDKNQLRTYAVKVTATVAAPAPGPVEDFRCDGLVVKAGASIARHIAQLDRLSLDDSSVALIQGGPADTLTLVGLKEGSTTLVVWRRDGRSQSCTVRVIP